MITTTPWSWHIEECVRSRADFPSSEENSASNKKYAASKIWKAASITMVAASVLLSSNAEAQYRIPLPGGYRVAPQMIMPVMRGASQLGWYGGSYLAQRQYGPSANPGRWPGLAPALGLRFR